MILPATMLARISRNYGGKTAYHCGPVSRTWDEMNDRSGRLAAGLFSQGLTKGDSVVILGKDSVEVFEHYFACMKAGFVRVSINWRYAAAEIAHILEDCDAKVVLVQAGFVDILRDALQIAELHGDCTLIGFGEGHGLEEDYDRLIAVSVPLEPQDLLPEEPLVISYTSGSSGVPKGVIHSHRSVALIIYQGAVSRGLTTDDVWYPAIASSWMACVLGMIGLVNGMTTVMMDGSFKVDSFINEVSRHKVTAALMVPTMIRRVLDACEGREEVLSSLRLLAYGSAPITVSLLKRVMDTLDVRFLQTYGLTEGGWVSHLTPKDHDYALANNQDLLRSVGRPGGMYEISIRNDGGELVPNGEIGEVWVRGETTMLGYRNLPELTKEVLVEGWLRTHDIGRFDEAGYLYLIDRKNFMIITGAVNVYPSSVEFILEAHPDVAEICVVGAPHPEWGEAVVAVVAPHNGRPLPSVEDLRAFGEIHLSRMELPKHVLRLDSFPRTSTEKVDKGAIRQFVRGQASALPWWQGRTVES
ncbi:class I adenylate-forming enzyme family protein [Amorphus sp. MBR-141]